MKRFKRQRLTDGKMILLQEITPETKIEVLERDLNWYIDFDSPYIARDFKEKKYILVITECKIIEPTEQFQILKRAWKWYKSQLIIDHKKYELVKSVSL